MTTNDYHLAAKKIEADGIDAYHGVCKLFGKEVASVLLIAHLRRHFGSMDGGYPPDPAIEGEVNDCLKENRIDI